MIFEHDFKEDIVCANFGKFSTYGYASQNE